MATLNRFRVQTLGTVAQFGFLALAAILGFARESAWWLVPLTLCLALVGWLTDHYWRLRFYDIYSVRDWAKFWGETLIGLICFAFAAYVAGRILRLLAQYYGFVL